MHIVVCTSSSTGGSPLGIPSLIGTWGPLVSWRRDSILLVSRGGTHHDWRGLGKRDQLLGMVVEEGLVRKVVAANVAACSVPGWGFFRFHGTAHGGRVYAKTDGTICKEKKEKDGLGPRLRPPFLTARVT